MLHVTLSRLEVERRLGTEHEMGNQRRPQEETFSPRYRSSSYNLFTPVLFSVIKEEGIHVLFLPGSCLQSTISNIKILTVQIFSQLTALLPSYIESIFLVKKDIPSRRNLCVLLLPVVKSREHILIVLLKEPKPQPALRRRNSKTHPRLYF